MKKIKATTLLIAMMGGCIALFLTYHVGFFFGQIDGLLKIVAEKCVKKLKEILFNQNFGSDALPWQSCIEPDS